MIKYGTKVFLKSNALLDGKVIGAYRDEHGSGIVVRMFETTTIMFGNESQWGLCKEPTNILPPLKSSKH